MGAQVESLADRLKFAVDAARDAGQLTLGFFQDSGLVVQRKGDDSPVTLADQGAEKLLRERILKAFPQDGVLGEEHGEVPGSSGFRWILDPIDGTKSFISGVPLYSQLIGVEQAGRSILGVIHIPALNEMVYAARGSGAWHARSDGTLVPARVSRKTTLREGLFVTSQVDSFAKRGAAEAYLQLQERAYVTRTWGDGYGYLLVATGRAEVMVDPAMHVWDAAAIQPVIEEAGGTFSDWRGERTIFGGEGVATNGLVRDEVLAITSRFSQGR